MVRFPHLLRLGSARGDKKINQSEAKEAIRIDMANEIFRLLENGRIGNGVGTGDIAVLVHSNFEAKEVWEYFRSRGLPRWSLPI